MPVLSVINKVVCQDSRHKISVLLMSDGCLLVCSNSIVTKGLLNVVGMLVMQLK